MRFMFSFDLSNFQVESSSKTSSPSNQDPVHGKKLFQHRILRQGLYLIGQCFQVRLKPITTSIQKTITVLRVIMCHEKMSNQNWFYRILPRSGTPSKYLQGIEALLARKGFQFQGPRVIESSDHLMKNGNRYEIKGYGKVLSCSVPNGNMLFICSRRNQAKQVFSFPSPVGNQLLRSFWKDDSPFQLVLVSSPTPWETSIQTRPTSWPP